MEPMDILLFFAQIFASFFATAATLVFLHCFYDTGYRWTWKKALLVLVEATASLLLSAIVGEVVAMLLILPLDFWIIIYDYKGKKLRAYLQYWWISILFMLTFTAISYVAMALTYPGTGDEFLAAFTNMDPAEFAESTDLSEMTADFAVPDSLLMFTCAFGAVFFGLTFCYLFFRLYKRGIVMRCRKRERVFLVLYPVLCFFMASVLFLFPKDSQAVLVVLTGMSMILALMIPVFVYHARISQHYKERTVHQENYMQAQLAHFTQYKQTQEETARFRHDIRNNLLCVNEMLLNGKTEEAATYLQDLLNTSESLRQRYVSGDEMLDCILGVKTGMMKEDGIRFQLDGVLAGGLNWKPVDICNVFANALDNAMDACRKLPPEEREITMTVKSTDRFWLVSVENPVQEDVDIDQLFRKNGGYTSKPNANQHGIGTYNMKHTVEQNGGILNASCHDRRFTLEIIIDKGSLK